MTKLRQHAAVPDDEDAGQLAHHRRGLRAEAVRQRADRAARPDRGIDQGRGAGAAEAERRVVFARRIADRDIAYAMLSSRKVYAPAETPLSETAPTGPTDPYGRHKLAVEDALRARLGDRLTVLRLANVFGYERMPVERH